MRVLTHHYKYNLKDRIYLSLSREQVLTTKILWLGVTVYSLSPKSSEGPAWAKKERNGKENHLPLAGNLLQFVRDKVLIHNFLKDWHQQ